MAIKIYKENEYKEVKKVFLKVDSAWKNVKQVFLKVNGLWKELLETVFYIYSKGIEAYPFSLDNTFSSGTNSNSLTFTKRENDYSIRVSSDGSDTSIVAITTDTAINLTKYTSLNVILNSFTVTSGGTPVFALEVKQSNVLPNTIARTTLLYNRFVQGQENIVSTDISSLSGDYYISLTLSRGSNGSGTITVSDIYLE